MKNLYSTLLLLVATVLTAQAPANYYNNATGSGFTLKTQLKNIITSGHNERTYASLWTLYNSSLRDRYYEDDDSLMDIYSENPNGTDPYNFYNTNDQCGNAPSEGSCYNREHLIPQSYFGGSGHMYSDAHHVVPSDGKVNNWRDNLPFGKVVTTTSSPCNSGATNTPCHSANGSKKGNNINSGYASGYSGIVFEPIDEFKGDVARSFFYFATRYQDSMDDFYASSNVNNIQAKVMFDGTNNNVFSQTFLNILITWHLNDPVSSKEIEFNNAIYQFQGNRNPFIDRPQYVCQIWPTACAALSQDDFVVSNDLNVYPNPSNGDTINIETDFDFEEIKLININGQVVQTIVGKNSSDRFYKINGLPKGFYILKLTAGKTTITKKVIIN